jgi:hypothetical protein
MFRPTTCGTAIPARSCSRQPRGVAAAAAESGSTDRSRKVTLQSIAELPRIEGSPLAQNSGPTHRPGVCAAYGAGETSVKKTPGGNPAVSGRAPSGIRSTATADAASP